MKMNRPAATTIDEYIAGFPGEVRAAMKQLRTTIKKAAPDAEEAIKYQIPTFVLNGNLVHFGAYKKHIGFYPGSSGIEKFRKELSAYEGGKGTVRFPLGKPIPISLVSRIVRFRVRQNLERATAKRTKK